MTASKIVAAAASSAGGAGLDVDEVFSTFLYTGDGSGRGINNNIDLLGEGGLVWTKERGASGDNNLIDTVRGATKRIRSDQSGAESTKVSSIISFENDGYNLSTDASWNNSGDTFVSWTFRKAPRFFDIQTWTGNGASDRAIPHNLESVPGMIIIKRRNSAEDWGVWHTEVHNNTASVLYLNSGDALTTSTHIFGATNPTSTDFYVGNHPVSNNNGDTYVAYVFAHNNNDGEFGPDADADIIKCGSYTGTGSAGKSVNLGFEPQWLMVKSATRAGQSWEIVDTMRRFCEGGFDERLRPNETAAGESSFQVLEPTSTGFQTGATVTDEVNESGQTYIYMAIRRGSLAVPDDATKVFSVNTTDGGNNKFNIGFVSDFNINTSRSGTERYAISRLTGARRLRTNGTNTQSGDSVSYKFWDAPTNTIDLNTGWWGSQSDVITWSWRRAPSYLDVVSYVGNGTSGRNLTHNLGAVPEMMWLKNREATESWIVYHKNLTATKYLMLDKNNAAITNNTRFNDTTPTSSVFTLGDDQSTNSPNGHKHIAVLFATATGISKVGSYTGNGQDGNVIDCGFTNGARFVMIKIKATTGSFMVWDSTRGIVSGNDPYLEFNTNSAESSSDILDPNSSGFIVNNNALVNANGYTYIFYAVA